MHFLNLPRSLLSTSFLLLAFSAVIPVSSTELTPETFKQTVDKGLWFIEHFSPYCSHCKHFKPTWDQLVVEAKTEVPSVKLATVDCIMHGDLCDKNGVSSYPTLLMFEDGKIVDRFKGARELDDLKTFIKRHVKNDPVVAAPAASAIHTPTPPKQPPPPALNSNGEVLSLTGDAFASALAKGPAFVKFFAPWCGHCKKLAPTWRNLAKHMQNKVTVAEVNCDDHSALCKSQGIEGYPTLVWYGQGADPAGKSEYNSGRKLEQLKAFAEKASAAGVQVLENQKDLDAHVASEDVVYLLLHSPTDASILNTMREASSPLLGSPQIFASSDPAFHTRFSAPSDANWALVALKDHDSKLPSSIFYGSDAPSSSDPKLRRWLLTHRLPTSLELTQDSFQSVMNAPQAPLVVIAAAPEALKEKIMARLRDVGKKWRVRTDGSGIVHGREVVYTWMDSAKWADWMRNMYGISSKEGVDELEDVQVVIADHSKLIYFDSDREGNSIKFTSSSSMFSAVDDAAAGKSAFKNSEGVIERVARYLNGKMQFVETFFTTKPFQAIFFLLVAFGAVFWVLIRLVGNDVVTAQQGQTEWREHKGRNGRLD
ncbi:hypothetical protein GALMADRAFT_250250 [Galerina marginata CBS 339.88]|uniref:Thioredoxin domain-containing protein n=1 Tax=Galerina marginata (strain CBS 339.88) TaxID=685588 RepID=A0A067SWE1_GALM3|nr:hypothetical protein GALMADRAFT_250250 [Galerina marginata CBS 339.88]